MSNVNPNEIAKFSALAAHWWDPQGEFKTLHDINPLRLAWLKQYVGTLSGKRILDVGCGGGIYAESMASEGADVTGIDMAQASLTVAKLHGLESGVTVDYRCIPVETLAKEQAGQFDVVTCMEMLEHVPDPISVIRACHALAKPGGKVLFSTLNRSSKAFLMAIVGAEYVLNLLPKGTHHYEKFIMPGELSQMARHVGLCPLDFQGITYRPLHGDYCLSRDTSVNYMLITQKC